MKKKFNEIVQLEEPILVTLEKQISLKDFYKDQDNTLNRLHLFPSLWRCETLQELISLIPDDYLVCDNNNYELYLPVSKKEVVMVKEFLPYIYEETINLSTDEGKKEAGRRLNILAHLLSLQSNGEVSESGGLHPGGCGTYIGEFLFPSGKKMLVLTYFKRDQGENGTWWFNSLESDELYVESGFWFAFSPKLKKLINSSSKIN